MPERAPSIGLIGAGIMGERLLRAILEQSPARLHVSGIWDPAPAAMARMQARFPALAQPRDAGALIAASDCVYIASPPAHHLDHGRAALAHGKVVFCEKPLAVDVADARDFVAQARQRGAVNFPFASSLAVATLRGWIAAGTVGLVSGVTIEVAFAAWPRSWQADAAAWLDAPSQGGFTREVVSHFLFLTGRLVGRLHRLEAQASFPEAGKAERAISARLFAGSVPVELKGSVGTTAKDDHNIWMVEGDKGAVRLRDWSIAERRMPDGSWQSAADALPQEQARPLALERQLQGVVHLIRGEPHHLATLSEALEVQEIVEAILKS